jgi:hypothetical protein
LQARYSQTVPINLRRPGFPENLLVTFADTPLDTSRAAIGAPATPTHFKVTSEATGRQFDIGFRDVNDDRTLSAEGEYIDVFMPEAEGSTRLRPTWRLSLDPEKIQGTLSPPAAGDVYRMVVNKPFGYEDAFTFTTLGEYVDPLQAEEEYDEEKPYVVPNPYVASASFEPERFAVAGRGVRRMEFRAIPEGATIRIYSLRGELVQTLYHDRSTTGMIPWDLRTKDNLEVAPGLYIFHVEADGVEEHVGKFAIIK